MNNLPTDGDDIGLGGSFRSTLLISIDGADLQTNNKETDRSNDSLVFVFSNRTSLQGWHNA